MTRTEQELIENTKRMIKIMQAFVDGAEIECNHLSDGWVLCLPAWDWNTHDYRVKTLEPKINWTFFEQYGGLKFEQGEAGEYVCDSPWYNWFGKLECPVPEEWTVDIRLRNGDIRHVVRAVYARWQYNQFCDFHDDDIIAFKIQRQII